MIFTSGTISNTVKLAELNNKWKQKKETGDLLSKSELNKRENWTQEQWLKNDFEEQLKKDNEANKKTSIDNKIMSGGTLTPEEEKYLEEKDPAALQRYRQIKIEKKTYEEKLKRCKTKDEVSRLKTETTTGYLSSFKKIENNPYIPIGEKLAKAQEMLAKTRNIEEAEKKFMVTAKYKNLPTEAEEEIDRVEKSEIEENIVVNEMEDGISNEKAEGTSIDSDGEVEESLFNDDKALEIEDIYNRIKISADLEFGVNSIHTEKFKDKENNIDVSV